MKKTNTYHKFLVIIVMYFITIPLFAATKSSQPRKPDHYIIAFDPYVGIYQSLYNNPSVLQKVEVDLKKHGYDPNQDYISVIGYALEMGYPDMKRFARPYLTKDKTTWQWHLAKNESLHSAFSPWPSGQPVLQNGPAASAQILAKPYSVISLQQPLDSTRKVANHTYLVMITDDVSNGGHNDYAKEWKNISTAGGANYSRFNQIESKVFEDMRSFNNDFKFITPNSKPETALSSTGGYRIIWHELIPSQHPSIHSVTNLPSPLPLKRVRGGFKMNLDANTLSDTYTVAEFNILSSAGDTLINASSIKGEYFIPSSKLANGDSIQVKLELLLNDGMYNGILLSPDNLRYQAGLRNTQTIKISDDAKIWGFIPLTDFIWWWYPNNAFKAVVVWDILIFLIVAAILLWIGYRTLKKAATYVPKDNSIKITHL